MEVRVGSCPLGLLLPLLGGAADVAAAAAAAAAGCVAAVARGLRAGHVDVTPHLRVPRSRSRPPNPVSLTALLLVCFFCRRHRRHEQSGDDGI